MGERTSSTQGHQATSTGENMQTMARLVALPSPELCDQLRAAVAVAATRDAQAIEALRIAVAEFTVALRNSGARPEAVLVSMKSLVSTGTLPPLERAHPDWAGYLLREKMSTWCIQEYFDANIPDPK